MQYRNEHGRVILDGAAEKSTVDPVAGEIMFTLPVGFRPHYEQFYGEVNDGHIVKIGTGGGVELDVVGTTDIVHLEALSFVADN